MGWLVRDGWLDQLGGRLEWDLSTLARSILEAASSVVGKRGSQVTTFMFQRTLPNGYGMRGRGHSPRNAVRVLPQWGQLGLSALSLPPSIKSWPSSVSAN